MREADVEAVVELLGVLFAQEREFTPDPGRQRSALSRLLADPTLGVVLVAEHDGTVTGTVTLLRSVSTATGGEVAVLEDLVVAEAARGAGTALLVAATRMATARGWGRITVLTDADNHAAQRLYAGHGFARSEMVVLRRGC